MMRREHFQDRLALSFSDRFAAEMKYVASLGRWYIWTGQRWHPDDTLLAHERCRHVCREAAEQCPEARDAEKLARASTIAAVERLARVDRRHAVAADDWDRDPWAFNTPAGTIDLRSGELREHWQDDLITKTAAASPSGACPLWLGFLRDVTGSDSELEAYLKRVVGYCLTGRTDEHALFFLYGHGANGKSVFCNTISAILGDYARTAAMDTFLSSVTDRHPTDLAALRGARLVTAVETELGRAWAESRIKTITGGDRVAARFMRQDFFEFQPQCKLIIAGNHLPALRSVGEAMKRRLHIIPFTLTIPADERDKTLTDRLLEERDGIMAWAVEGCREWQEQGLSPPTAVLTASRTYFEDADPIGRWLNEWCRLEPSTSTSFADLYASWKGWAEASSAVAGSEKSFSEALRGRGFDRYRKGQARGFNGIAIRAAAATQCQDDTDIGHDGPALDDPDVGSDR